MGNWHCIPSSCAEVVYQPYETGKIRWRYGTEPWQEIKGTGLTYTTKVSNDLIGTGSFHAITQIAVRGNGSSFVGWQSPTTSSYAFPYTSIDDYCLIQPIISGNCMSNNEWGVWMLPPSQRRDYGAQIKIWANGTTYLHGLGAAQGHKIVDFIPSNPAKQKTKCDFKIFDQNGTQIRTETRSTCPQVEKIPCSLSDVRRSVEVKKIPYLQRAEVVPYQYSAYKLPGVGAPIAQADPIPAECLNIYYNDFYVIPPPENAVKYPDAKPFATFVAQICSAPGCPPPVYEVICDCQCEKCSDYTCPIECGDYVCCYNDYGVSVQTIPKDKYCGGKS